MTAKEILLKAAEDFEREPHTWIQGVYSRLTTEGMCYCLVGKIYSLDPDNVAVVHCAGLALRGTMEGRSASWWNDEPGRTVQDVILACRKAAEAA